MFGPGTASVLAVCVMAAAPAFAFAQKPETTPAMQWPKVERQMRPWTRWWWLGSAVDRADLTRLLETYRKAGLGGVEITPIYGVKGQEARELPYLSPAWLEMLKHVLSEADRLDMGVDMPTGTGWPFGGPQVTDADAEDRRVLETVRLAAGEVYRLPPGQARPQALVAVSEQGRSLSLRDKIDAQGHLEWDPPAGHAWTVYRVTQKWSGRDVKRAAPGGAGKCINPFSRQSLTHYLQRFDAALSGLPPGALRCHFHDSFEYAADWAPTLFEVFQARRGYDLRDHLPAFAGNADPDEGMRVYTDYRETLSDMLLENFTETWTAWAHRKGSLSRNQAHGSPGNLLDLYAAADIPETEVFHSIGDPRVTKFASSAAHVMGKPLASSESCTWQSEHFTETLAQSKRTLDRLLVGGINHIFYHGTAYSPADAAWPGWLFYASTHFEPNNTLWHDFPVLNAYVTRCQSILQAGRPDNDVLLYWPLHDLWQNRRSVFGLTIEGKWLESEPVGHTAQTLWDRGFAYDYVSDRQLRQAKVEAGRVRMPGGVYQTVLIPPCRYMPLDTLKTLLALADRGATLLFQERLPEDVPGLGDLESRRRAFRALLSGLTWVVVPGSGIRQAHVGKGCLLVGPDAAALLELAHVRREPIVDHPGLMCLRRTHAEGWHYLLVHQGETALDGWIDLGTPARSAVILDPMTGRTGLAKVRRGAGGRTQVYLQMQPGESVLLRTFASKQIAGPDWRYLRPVGTPIPLGGTWTVDFTAGGPVLPRPFRTGALASWTEQNDAEAQRFAGTGRYTLTFDAPGGEAEMWMLDLGEVHESAQVRLNGQEVGVQIGPPFRLPLGPLQKTGNVLEVEVTNLAANRIRDLDRRKVPWKIFHEINFVNIAYRPFDASDWPLYASGLLGPVRLLPMQALRP
jgi:hypothetical protein